MTRRFGPPAAACLALAGVTATAQDYGAEMPAEPVPGLVFPTPETELNRWVFGFDPDLGAIYRHGWAIWAGLTAATDRTAFVIENALVYQTWLSPQAILDLLQGRTDDPILGLRTPLQHLRGEPGPSLMAETPTAASGLKIDTAVAEVVAYSPVSARHVHDNELLLVETLLSYLQAGYTSIPRFPAASVNVKPVYKRISADELNAVDGRSLYALPAWPGTPDVSGWSDAQKAAGYPNTLWGQCTYVDMNLAGPTAARGVDATCATPGPDNIYSLDDFIHIRITADDQAYFEDLGKGQLEEDTDGPLAVGDVLILVGMHVTTREMERWTWQTFWWAADPDAPNAPSSAAIAAERPDSLTGAARHYAMAAAYSMLIPAQPLTGGRNEGALVAAYNPHLEAPFGTGVFGETRAVRTPSGSVTTDLGVQSNCMSCHGMAGFATANATYVSNFYVPRDAPNLAGGLDADFAWSIVDDAVTRFGE